MVVAAERAGTHIALAMRLAVSTGRLVIPVKRARAGPWVVVDVPAMLFARAVVAQGVGAIVAVKPAVHVVGDAAVAAVAVIIVAVVKRVAVRVVGAVVVDHRAPAPVSAPVIPAPAVAAIETDSEANPAPIKARTAPPDSGIVVPIRPRGNGIAVNQPRIVSRNVNYLRVRGLNDDIRSLALHRLLVGRFQVARALRFLAHELNGVHHVLLLVVIGVAQ